MQKLIIRPALLYFSVLFYCFTMSMQAVCAEQMLLHAAQTGNLEIAGSCIAQGADINVQDCHGKSALHHAASKGYTDMVKFLIENKARIDARGYAGKTALHEAAAHDHAETVACLVTLGASVRELDCNNRTPYELASFMDAKKAIAGFRKIVELQLKSSL